MKRKLCLIATIISISLLIPEYCFAVQNIEDKHNIIISEMSSSEMKGVGQNKDIFRETTRIITYNNSNVIFLNGEKKELNTEVYISNDKYLMLPLRSILTLFAVETCRFEWIDKEKLVVELDDQVILFDLNLDITYINGLSLENRRELEIKNDRLMISRQDLSRILGIFEDHILCYS